MRNAIILIFVLLFSSNTGAQWSLVATINSTELRGVKFFNEWTGIAVGVGGIWRSTNSGVNWTQVLSGVNMNSVSFPDINTGYAVGDSGKIYKTTDNGLNWASQISNTTNHLYGVSFFNVSTGFAVGQNGVILKTTNGSASWTLSFHAYNEDINCVQMVVDNTTALIVGSESNENFCSTANGGINWPCTMHYPNNMLKSVCCDIPWNTGIILAVGNSGRVRRTTNFGSYWSVINTGFNLLLTQVFFTSTDSAYIAGYNGLILVSSNAGLNWSQQNTPTGNNLIGISFINNQTGWAVGGNGIVIRKGIPVGITKIENSVPTEFKLYQNYPNPFNPSTKIRFDVAGNNSHVVLEIYDVLGRKIQTLINENLNTGSYEVDWNAEGYGSGVYICCLKIHNKVFIKKILLIK